MKEELVKEKEQREKDKADSGKFQSVLLLGRGAKQ